MSLTTDPNDPCLKDGAKETGQNECYLVLSAEERAKGFIRPYRDSYQHVGKPGYKPCGKRLEILQEGHDQYPKYHAVMCTAKPDCKILHKEDGECFSRSYLTKEQYEQAQVGNLNEKKGCMSTTTMGRALSETYAINPKFYGATFCVQCNKHLPVDEFVWSGTNELVGS